MKQEKFEFERDSVIIGNATGDNATASNSSAGNSTDGNSTDGNATASNTTAGNSTAGNSIAGNSTAGNSTAGNSTAGNSTAGNTSDNNSSDDNHILVGVDEETLKTVNSLAAGIGVIIAKLRKRKGGKNKAEKEQFYLAKKIGMSQAGIARLENNKVRRIDPRIIILLAMYFEVSTDYLLGLSKEEKPANRSEDMVLVEKIKQLTTKQRVFLDDMISGLKRL